MRILMLAPRCPYPPNRGDTVRSWPVLNGLAERHELWLACVDTVEPRPADLDHVRQRCREVAVFTRPAWRCLARGVLSALTGASVTAGYYEDPRLIRTLHDWCQRTHFDALLTYSSSIARAAQAVPTQRRVLDLCDVDSAKWATYARRSGWPLAWLYRLESLRVAHLEHETARRHDLCLVVNDRERRKLMHVVPQAHAEILPTTVDLTEYAPPADAPQPPAEPVVGMVGSMFYPPNVRAVNWFGRYVWPRVRQSVPAARWLIVGSRPNRQVQRWAREPGVTVTGFVPDVRPHLHSMRVFASAVDGDLGVQSKLIVAMAAGRAAVVTPDTAAGIVYDDPPPFLIAGAPAGFAEAVVRLLRDDAQARAVGRRARAVAEANYSAARQVPRVEHWLGGRSETTPHVDRSAAAGQEVQPAAPALAGKDAHP